MSKYLDTAGTYDFKCPNCGNSFKQSVAGLEHDFDTNCPKCHESIRVKTHEARRTLEQVDEQLDDLQRNLGKMLK